MAVKERKKNIGNICRTKGGDRISLHMQARRWIKQAEAVGWRVAGVKGLTLTLKCSCHGCDGSLKLPLDNLGPPPEPCPRPHKHGYSRKTFDQYETFVGELRRRRMQLGMDQTDLNNALGLTDGYINKLESFARTPSAPVLIMWCQALGVSLTTAPAPLPPASLKVIEDRAAAPYQPNQARFKHNTSGTLL